MRDKVCVVTGANSGIGKEITRGLAGQGAHVVMLCRNPAKAEAAAADIRTTATGRVDIALADLGSLDAVRAAAATLLERYSRLDVLVSNAGVFSVRRRETSDGNEQMLGVNHLAPFLLVDLLRPGLAPDARIVVVASEAHRGQRIDIENLQLNRRFGSWRGYGRSKLCNIMFTYALARRIEGTGVTANCMHPGFVATGLGSGNRIPVKPFYALMRPFIKTPQQGADTAVWLASSSEVEGLSGGYFVQRRPARSSGVSYDEELQEALWEESARLTAR
jgi:NAD(P)-dependent dehydrogenase (short-subunit alcohol dehydrogenase family)